MAQKTNKSFAKRIKVTANGKTLVRKPGRNHYNAKKTRGEQQEQNGLRRINLPSRIIQNNLPHAGVHNTGKANQATDVEIEASDLANEKNEKNK